MKRLLRITIVIALAFTLCFNTKVSADDYHKMYDSPELIYNTDMVFSVAKGEVDDWTTNGIQYDGRPYAEYSQIHENVNGSGNNGRYTIHAVSGGAISYGIQQTLGDGDIRNINENILGGSDIVETILRDYAGIDYEKAYEIAKNYIAYNRNLELGCFTIDWYAMKTQQDGKREGRIHIDGRVVINEVEPEPEIEEPVIEEPIVEEPTIEEPEVEEPIIDEPIEEPIVEVTSTPTSAPIPRFIIIPPIEEPTPTVEPTAIPTPELVITEAPIPELVVVDIDDIETPEGAPEEEVEVEPVDVPEGAPEEEIPIDLPDVPEGDILPQTGVADSLVFFLFGGWMIALGALLIKRTKI